MTGFPYLTLAGQFPVKDLVLASASIVIAATDAAKHALPQADAQATMPAKARVA